MEDMCRTCMVQFTETNKKFYQNKQSIDEVPTGCKDSSTIMELLRFVQPQIIVEIKGNLPTVMCSDCIQKLLVSCKFIQMYKNADKKFRAMLMENARANKCYEELDVPLEFVKDEEDYVKEGFEKQTDIYKITKYELEIEQLNVDSLAKEEETNNDWPEFKDVPLGELSDDSEYKEEYFLNPYSDASDNEWKDYNSSESSKDTDSLKIQNIRIDDGKIKSTKISKRKVSKNTNKNEELPKPIENDDGSISCPQCELVLDNAQLWQEHVQLHRLEKTPKRKYTKKLNKIRKTKSKGKSNYECEHCGKGFKRISYYKVHLRVHTGEEPYLCIECGKGFRNVSSLNTHMLRHKGEKTVQCPHCPKKFVCASGLYGHMMVHTKERPYVCDICGSAFHMAYQLRKHNLYHNGIKNYQCEYCDMRFVTREKQRRHMRTHTGEKPYSCKYCERAFAQSNDCVKHLRQHLGDNVYQCELCPLRFPLARDLRVHFATHKDDDEETRSRNLEARSVEERNLQLKFGSKET